MSLAVLGIKWQQDQPHTIKTGVAGNYQLSDLPLFIQQKISFGLTDLRSDGSATTSANSIASEFYSEENGRIWVFKIRENLFWHDGTLFHPMDVNYALKDGRVESVKRDTLRFVLKEPYSPFSALVAQPLFKERLMGLGEYQVRKIEYETEKIKSLELTNKKTKEKLVYRFYPTEKSLIIAFKLGEVDKIEKIEDLTAIEKWPRIKISRESNYHKLVAVFYNQKDNLLGEKAIRQALTYALPDDFGENEIASSSLPPNSWAYSDKIKKYPLDLGIAQKMIEKSSASQSAEIKITLHVLERYETLANRIKEEWEKIKIKTEIKLTKEKPEEYQAFLGDVDLPMDPDQYLLWHSTQKITNITNYKNVRVDKMLEDGRHLIDKEERFKKYADFQLTLSNDCPAAFLYYPTVYSISK